MVPDADYYEVKRERDEAVEEARQLNVDLEAEHEVNQDLIRERDDALSRCKRAIEERDAVHQAFDGAKQGMKAITRERDEVRRQLAGVIGEYKDLRRELDRVEEERNRLRDEQQLVDQDEADPEVMIRGRADHLRAVLEQVAGLLYPDSESIASLSDLNLSEAVFAKLDEGGRIDRAMEEFRQARDAEPEEFRQARDAEPGLHVYAYQGKPISRGEYEAIIEQKRRQDWGDDNGDDVEHGPDGDEVDEAREALLDVCAILGPDTPRLEGASLGEIASTAVRRALDVREDRVRTFTAEPDWGDDNGDDVEHDQDGEEVMPGNVNSAGRLLYEEKVDSATLDYPGDSVTLHHRVTIHADGRIEIEPV